MHIAYTCSSGYGMRLYVNGAQYATSGSFSTAAARAPVYITIGSKLCSPLYGGSFDGVVDEFYVFSRELTATEILALVNP
jgi:hypothetical protein